MSYDAVIVGGGLAGSLAAWRLAARRPDLRFCVLEAGRSLGGNHTWSFHESDLTAGQQAWVDPLVVGRWEGHEVRFDDRVRRLAGGYRSITSDRLHAVVAPAIAGRLRLETAVERVGPTAVTLSTGETLVARLVIDARGGLPADVPVAWQTFVGQELDLQSEHGLRGPVLMDATVPQVGGYRFVYLLPWTATRLLVEDTVYADGPAIDVAGSRDRIAAYVRHHGWRIERVAREEQGALPIPLAGSGRAFWTGDTVRIGVRAGLFHPTTGYSLADAVTTADLLAGMDLRDAERVYQKVRDLALSRWRERGFFRLLNRLLFRAAEPESRVRILDQFYRRPEPLIARFYAGRLTWLDHCRLLTGRPPVPVTRALAHVWAGEA